jgi:hypothetical protein
MVRLKWVARFYGLETKELHRLVERWNSTLAQWPSIREEYVLLTVLDDHIRRLASPQPNFPLDSILVGGQWFRPGYPYILQTKRTPPKNRQRCYHRPLQDVEFAPLTFYRCSDCGGFGAGDVGHVNQSKFFGRKKQAKSKYRATPTAGDDTPNNGSEFDPRGEFDSKGTEETDAQWIAKFQWMWKLGGRCDPVSIIRRGWQSQDIESEAPEIEYRQQRAALRYFDLSVPSRYRAPHAKVRELSQLGFTQMQIAHKLKVSERTIRERVSELPPEPPKESTAADLLPLIVRAGGGWAKGKSWQRWTTKPFWPGADKLPRGSTEASPGSNRHTGTRLQLSIGPGAAGFRP